MLIICDVRKSNSYISSSKVYCVGGKEGTNPDSIYIGKTQIQKPGGELKPVSLQRSKSMRTPGRVVRSDAYDDGKAHLYREGLSKDKKILQNANVRRSLSMLLFQNDIRKTYP